MIKTKRNIILPLVLCALLLPTTLIAKKQVERPFRLYGENIVIVDLSDLSQFPIVPWWIESEVGEATNLGRYTSSGGGTINLLTGHLTGSGDDTASNGDELSWEMEGSPDIPYILTYTGGTGRFEGASGSLTLTFTEATVVQEGDLLINTQTFSGIGTLTY
jgi:hypothetical protein